MLYSRFIHVNQVFLAKRFITSGLYSLTSIQLCIFIADEDQLIRHAKGSFRELKCFQGITHKMVTC